MTTTKRDLSRRDFLKTGALGLGALAASRVRFGPLLPGAVAATGPPPRPAPGFVTTTCMQCMNQCGVIARLENGVVAKLDGNPEHPANRGRLCAKGQAGIRKLYDPQRVLYPLRRVGRRGEGRWERISWEAALDEVAARLRATRDRFGARSVAYLKNVDYDAVDLARRFCYAFGTPNFVEHGANCVSSYAVGQGVALGPYAVRADLARARHVLLFGANPLGIHTGVRGIRDFIAAQERGAHIVAVDPRFTDTAAKADEWLPIVPGTDGALLLAMIHTLISEELYDRAFVARHTLGFDKLRAFIRPYTPEWAAGLTDVPTDTIRRLAREFAGTKPAVAEGQRGIAAHTNGTATAHALTILNALAGSVDAPGGLLLFPLPGLGPVDPEPPRPAGPRMDRATYGRLPRLFGPPDEYPATFAGVIETVADAVLDEDPYPIHALILDGTSPAYAIPDLARQEAALAKVDFIVSLDVFLGESTIWADIVLPAATYLESWDVATNFNSPDVIGLRRPVVPPLGQARPTAEILLDLARRLELDFFDFTYREFVAEGVRAWGTTLEELEARGFAQRPDEVGRYRREGFGTPSGKVELYATLLANSGLNGLPAYERPRGHTPEIAAEYPLFLITPKLNVHTQSRTAGNPYLSEIIGENWAELHPETAASLGIADGDLVWVESSQGRIRLKARVGPFIHPRTVAVPHHFGHTAYNDTAQSKGANPNRIIALDWDRVGGNTAFNDTMVRVYRGAGERGSRGARERGSRGEEEQGRQGAREQRSGGAGETGGQGAREQRRGGDGETRGQGDGERSEQ